MKNHKDNDVKMDRREAINKIGDYGKYASLTALGTYLFLNPLKGVFTLINCFIISKTISSIFGFSFIIRTKKYFLCLRLL